MTRQYTFLSPHYASQQHHGMPKNSYVNRKIREDILGGVYKKHTHTHFPSSISVPEVVLAGDVIQNTKNFTKFRAHHPHLTDII